MYNLAGYTLRQGAWNYNGHSLDSILLVMSGYQVGIAMLFDAPSGLWPGLKLGSME